MRLSEIQAIVGFPKFFTVGIGFAQEEDWNTNLPFTCDADEIYEHIAHNEGDDSISREDCIAAIRLVQEAAAAVATEYHLACRAGTARLRLKAAAGTRQPSQDQHRGGATMNYRVLLRPQGRRYRTRTATYATNEDARAETSARPQSRLPAPPRHVSRWR